MKERFQNHVRDWKKTTAITSWRRYAACIQTNAWYTRINNQFARYLKTPLTNYVFCDACKCNHASPALEGFEEYTYPLYRNVPLLERMSYLRCCLAINIVTELHYKNMIFVPTKAVYILLLKALNEDIVEIIMKYARAMGLDAGPMSGFEPNVIDEEFFSNSTFKCNFLCNIGYGDESAIFHKLPRLSFDEACRIT